MLNKLKQLQNLQIVRYALTGGATTGVNYVIYMGLNVWGVHYLISNTAAWLCAVIFAYFVNRSVVFCSDGNRKREFLRFASLRLMTLISENLLLFALVDYMGWGSLIAKISVSIVTVFLNYWACKYVIFRERGVSHG